MELEAVNGGEEGQALTNGGDADIPKGVVIKENQDLAADAIVGKVL